MWSDWAALMDARETPLDATCALQRGEDGDATTQAAVGSTHVPKTLKWRRITQKAFGLAG